jgi:hypothetical protein
VLPHQLIERPAIPRPRTLHQDAVCFLHRPYSDARTPWCVGPAAPHNPFEPSSRKEALRLRWRYTSAAIEKHGYLNRAQTWKVLSRPRARALRPPDSGLGARSAGPGSPDSLIRAGSPGRRLGGSPGKAYLFIWPSYSKG